MDIRRPRPYQLLQNQQLQQGCRQQLRWFGWSAFGACSGKASLSSSSVSIVVNPLIQVCHCASGLARLLLLRDLHAILWPVRRPEPAP